MKLFHSILILVLLISCSHTQNPIQLNIVRKTSDLIHCDKIFAEEENSIDVLNEIMIQTGQLDTSDERKQWVAVINVNNSDLILNQTNNLISDGITTEEFEANGYKLVIRYGISNGRGNYNVYKGEAIITYNNKVSKYKIVGKDNLGYL